MRQDIRKPSKKTEPTFKYKLTKEQKEAKETILNNKIAVLTGKPGTSKSFLAAQIALDLKIKGSFEKIYLCRSAVSSEDIGFLPGDVNDKMKGLVAPIIVNMENLRDKGEIKKMIEKGDIELLPIQYLSGRTVTDSIIIVDEAQNLTPHQVYQFATRLGKGSLMIFTGDVIQTDLKAPKQNGLTPLIEVAKTVEGMCHIEMKENYRDPIIVDFMEAYEKYLPESLKKAANVDV